MAKVAMPERTFPRGGTKPKKRDVPSVDFSLFKRKKSKQSNQTVKTKKPSSKTLPVGEALDLTTVNELEIIDVRPGMCILGCIDNITQLTVELSLPGGIRALINGTNINSQYTAMIQDNHSELPALSELFEIGEYFPVSIISKSEQGGKQFLASLNPKDVNAKLSPRFLRKSLMLNGSVVSVEEHGVIIDVGISKVAAFMPNKSLRTDHVYTKGQLINAQITSVKSEGHAIQVADVRTGKILTAVNDNLPLNSFTPGIKWSLMVTKVLKNGVEVGLKGFGPEMKGFIYVTHLKKLFDKTSNYEVGMDLQGTLLYILPVVNYAYFQVSNLDRPKWALPYGVLVNNVRIVRISEGGLIGKITTAHKTLFEKCFVPINRLDEYEKIVEGKKNLAKLYQVGTILPKVRIEWPSRMSRFYFAAIDRASLRNQPYTKSELKIGQVVKCVLSIVGAKYNTVEITKTLKGFVAHEHMTDKPGIDANSQFKPGMKFKARVLSLGEEADRAKLTLRPSLVKSERFLSPDTIIKKGETYPGFVRHVDEHRIVMEFFGGRKAYIPRERLPVPRETSLRSAYKQGQVLNCSVVGEKNLTFSLVYNESIDGRLTVGTKYHAVVASAVADGFYLNVEVGPKTTCLGFLPKNMMSSHEPVATQLMKVTYPGSKLKVFCVHIDPLRTPTTLFSTHPAISYFYKRHKLELKKGTDVVEVNAIVPLAVLPSGSGQVLIPAVPHSAALKDSVSGKKCLFKDYQIIVGKIESIFGENFRCTTDVGSLWDHDYLSSLELLSSFLTECDELQTKINNQNSHSLYGRHVGEIVEAIVDSVDGDTSSLSIQGVQGRNRATVKCCKVFKPAARIHGRVVWIDYDKEVVWVQSVRKADFAPQQENKPNIRAHIVYSGTDVVVAEAVRTSELVFIPTLKHMNDAPVDLGYKVGEKTKLSVHRLRSKLCGIDRKIALNCDRRLTKAPGSDGAPAAKRAKLKEGVAGKNVQKDPDILVEYVKEGVQSEGLQEVKLEQFSDEEMESVAGKVLEVDDDSDPEIKLECDSRDGMEINQKLSDSSDIEDDEMKPEPVDLDVGFDWSVAENPDLLKGALSRAVANDSSSSDEEDDTTEKKKRKRLTGSEKREKARGAEEQLRAREEALVDPTRPPQSADDFDRLTVSTPDDSSVWLKYMAFHLENTEIEKARAVARRALKVISFREEQEKLNVWLALLNLEQLYGTTESQKDTLDEALRCNEPYKIHSHKLNALVDAGAGLQAEQLANVMIKKYGENEEVWCEAGGALMRLGKLDYARKVLQRGMSSLPPTKHVSLITRFAQLENKYGSNERAQTLYENVITLFPKRVDVWSAYVDLLVKIGNIDFARTTLERSVSQSLPPKKMKVLFKKFITFEETLGTPENAEKVRQAAAEFVESIGSND